MAATTTATKATLRKDPVRRHVDGSKGAARLRQQDPDRVYVYAYRADPLTGESYYRDRGYRVECWPKDNETDKVRPWNGDAKPGEPIEQRGHVLMSISKEAYADLVQNGSEDCGGQVWCDEVERKIIDKDQGGYGLEDGLRGISRKFRGTMYVENETSALTPMGGF